MCKNYSDWEPTLLEWTYYSCILGCGNFSKIGLSHAKQSLGTPKSLEKSPLEVPLISIMCWLKLDSNFAPIIFPGYLKIEGCYFLCRQLSMIIEIIENFIQLKLARNSNPISTNMTEMNCNSKPWNPRVDFLDSLGSSETVKHGKAQF